MKLSLHWPKFPVAVEDIAKGWELCYCVHWVQLKQMKFLTLIKDIQDIPLKANKNWKQVQKLMVYMNIFYLVCVVNWFSQTSCSTSVLIHSLAQLLCLLFRWWYGLRHQCGNHKHLGRLHLGYRKNKHQTLGKSLCNPWKSLRPFGFSGILSVAAQKVLNL